jgi:glutamate racemase
MNQAIGIFDSGLGGLTVLKTLSKSFPNESFCYLGDIARLPYGNKSPETIRKYGLQIFEYLKNQNVKAIIIACNSASSVFMEDHDYFGIPVFNVITPGTQAALSITKNNRVGVLGTSATIRSGAYTNCIKSFSPKTQVTAEASPLLVPLVEEGWSKDEVTRLVLAKYLAPFKAAKVDTLILGCTHYPVLKGVIKELTDYKMELIESGEVLANTLRNQFADGKIQAASIGPGSIHIHITDLTDHFEKLAKELLSPQEFTLTRVVI